MPSSQSMNEDRFSRPRLLYFALLLLTIAIGLATRQYADLIPRFIAIHAGDTLWTVAVFLCLGICCSRCSTASLGFGALAISWLVEFSQLLDITWLNAIRDNGFGRLILGSGFLRVDLLRYAVGAGLVSTLEWLATGRAGLADQIK